MDVTKWAYLKEFSEIARQNTSLEFVRPLYDTIDWEGNLTALLGARGVGKTTLILQRLKKLGLPPGEALYVDMGDLYFQENRLFDFIKSFVEQGGRYLFIDEIHRYGYETWAQELKQSYDLFRRRISIVFTGSSAIRILAQKADLSRRALQHRVPGLSFREYLRLKEGISLPAFSFKDILERHSELNNDLLNDNWQPLQHLPGYLEGGYYPFFLADSAGYRLRLNEIVMLVLQSDIPHASKSAQPDYHTLGRLLFAIASSVPFTPNISKLSSRMGLARATLLSYLRLLEDADIILSLRKESKGFPRLANQIRSTSIIPTLFIRLPQSKLTLGPSGKHFFLTQLDHVVSLPNIVPTEIRLPKKGDFTLIDKGIRYLFEVGGPNKEFRQIGEQPHHYLVTDTVRTSHPNKIPLWLFGLLY